MDSLITYWKNDSLDSLSDIYEGVLYVELWKDIPNYEGLYQASTFGRIKKLKRTKIRAVGTHTRQTRILTQTMNKWGYVYVELDDKHNHLRKVFVHVLVAKTFIPNPFNKPEANHKCGIKHDCRVSQLEWNTKSENQKHAYKIGLKKANKTMLGKIGYECPNSIPINQYTKSGDFIREWPSQTEAARVLGLSQGNIWSAINGTYKQTGGFIFKYAEV